MKRPFLRGALCALLLTGMILGLTACGIRPEPAAADAPAATEAPVRTVVTPTPAPTPEATPEPTPEATPEPTPEPLPVDGEVLTDDDGDGIIQYKFNYKGATVYALIVLDPGRVFVGTALPEPNPWGGNGLTLDLMAEQYGAVAGINAGGFMDENGAGNGWPPRGITYGRGMNFNGEIYGPIAGLDNSNHLWSGYYSFEDCEVMGIRDAVCFGPALVQQGYRADAGSLESGIGARTAIGQREDGSIVMMVVDGRQGYSIGITFEDCVAIMADKFGCVNASNMDGGNSSCMYYEGAAVNRSANQAGGTRYLPDAWLVSPLPEGYVKPEGVPRYVVLPENPLGEQKAYAGACDADMSARLYDFACAFAGAYYGYFGTKNSDYYYPTLLQFVASGSELRERVDLALMDRMWVNTYRTDVNNIVLDGAYVNGDGSYDVVITSDIHEYAEYWDYDASGTTLRITVVEAPGTAYGFLAVATF